MANSILVQEKAGIGSIPAARQQSPDIATIAEGILGKALARCAKAIGLDSAEATTAVLREQDAIAYAHYGAAIARLAAETIGTSARTVKAVYALGDGEAEVPDPDVPLVHLLAWVGDRTPTFNASVAALDRALVQGYNNTIRTPERVTLLDVHTIRDVDIEQLFGSGRGRLMPLRLAAYLLAQNEDVDTVYVRDGGS